jgi:lipopolysaccharide export system protein LptA
MRKTFASAIIFALCTTVALAQGVSTMKGVSPSGNTIVISAVEIEGIGSTKLVLKGKARVKSFDKKTNTTLDAAADKIVVMLLTATDGARNIIKAAELTGSPKIVYTSIDSSTGKPVTTTATSTNATYDGVQQIAFLKGNVRIENENLALFEGPAVLTGDEATINLKPSLGSEEVRFRIKSEPPGVSTIQVVPKSKEETQKK